MSVLAVFKRPLIDVIFKLAVFKPPLMVNILPLRVLILVFKLTESEYNISFSTLKGPRIYAFP